MLPRGIRNNNPGNIRDFQDWVGEADFYDRTPAQVGESEFVVFSRPWYGIRAIVRILQNYQAAYYLTTIGSMLDRYAPKSENDTARYAEFVSAHVGVGPNFPIDINDPEICRKMVEAIIKFENGYNPYSWEIDAGMILAGVDPESTHHVRPA